MLRLHAERNVLLLTACQALFWGALMIGITMSGLVGQMLADHQALATPPAGIMAVTTVFAARPASLLMQRWGRRIGFAVGLLAGVVGGKVWYNESGKRPDALVCFDPETEIFQSWAIPSGGVFAGIIRHMRPDRAGDLLIHQSSTNRITRVRLKPRAATQ